MSGDTYHFGDSVNMYGGSGNTGMVKNIAAPAAPPALSPELQEAIKDLLRRVEALRGQLPPASAQVLDASLPDATGGADVPAQARQSALMSIAGIAAVVGPLGQPIVDAVTTVLELLGGA
ncbi:hypothetical protein HYE82_35570 [Streptomyces sp. BR123]|uniref:hypothetical protein n=1 Tax=Streptomyces sp. BR123 TaxID=2749828 RepID=UPI0015C49AD0|nr:hypothetical protein [Streptomyces sp. BR123]NXY99599.1 hypothetical protein [Streptomyces sp. BR123]